MCNLPLSDVTGSIFLCAKLRVSAVYSVFTVIATNSAPVAKKKTTPVRRHWATTGHQSLNRQLTLFQKVGQVASASSSKLLLCKYYVNCIDVK